MKRDLFLEIEIRKLDELEGIALSVTAGQRKAKHETDATIAQTILEEVGRYRTALLSGTPAQAFRAGYDLACLLHSTDRWLAEKAAQDRREGADAANEKIAAERAALDPVKGVIRAAMVSWITADKHYGTPERREQNPEATSPWDIPRAKPVNAPREADNRRFERFQADVATQGVSIDVRGLGGTLHVKRRRRGRDERYEVLIDVPGLPDDAYKPGTPFSLSELRTIWSEAKAALDP